MCKNTTNPESALTSRVGRNDLLPDLQIIHRPLQELKPSQNAVRKEKKKHVERLKASIERFGMVRPILARGNEIVDGHSLVAAARELGLETVPCIDVSHLDDREVRLLRIALNKTQELGTWDEQALKLEFAYQLEFNTDLTITGFEGWEIDHILEIGDPDEGAEGLDADIDLPAPDAEAVSQPGDFWRLGPHGLLCCNARSAADLDRLVADRAVALVWTDPPFNVPVGGHVTSSSEHPEFHEASGEMTSEEFEDFLVATLGNAARLLPPGGLLYTFMDWRGFETTSRAIRRIGLDHIQQAIWVKTYPGQGSFYRSQHEQVFIARMPGAPHRNNIELGAHGRNRTNVWHYAGATGGGHDDADDFKSHPTAKPVRLIEDALLDVTAAGEWVLDPFLGSGSTLLAAERTQRRCLGLEISPAYVDLAIRRWQDMTGEAVVHTETGRTFAELSVQRSNDESGKENP